MLYGGLGESAAVQASGEWMTIGSTTRSQGRGSKEALAFEALECWAMSAAINYNGRWVLGEYFYVAMALISVTQ